MTRFHLSFISLIAAVGFIGCAEPVGDIDRTQPNGYEKSFFTDEWYYQRTVVDVPSGNGFTFVGSTDYSGLTIISWDIQERWLLARRRTELIEGADDLDQTGDDYEGEVVAAFPISSHFDVQRQYNAQTGEETNVIVENTTDREWHQREYIRVDWARNRVTNYQYDFETQSVETVDYFVQEQDPDSPHPDAPHFAEDGTYFDITNKLFARAGTVHYEGYGDIPSCWLFGNEFDECGAGEYAIRHSFLRRDAERQYVPQPYKGPTTDLFGFFTADRMRYDPQNGIREQDRTRYLTRHNMWENWYDPSDCTTPGDVSTCREIPFADRTLRPIVYHVNVDFPDDLKPIADVVADQWNDVFNDVVVAQGYPLAPGERTFIACTNNPVREGDPAACGAPGTSPRLGDIRYSFMAYVPKYMQYGLLGLGPSNNDPVTGEIISGMGYVYHHNNLSAYNTVEMIQVLNAGADSPLLSDFIDGTDLTEWADRVTGRVETPSRTYGLEDAAFMVRSIANGWMTQYWEGQLREITAEDIEMLEQRGFAAWSEPYLNDMHRRGLLNGERHAGDARLRNIADTYIEDLLLNDEILMSAGRMPGERVTHSHREVASVARGGFGQLAVDRTFLREAYAEANNMYLPEMADDALMGIARELANSNASVEEMYERVRTGVYTAVLAHEVGHSLGLMHNFGGSDDVFNYFDEYFDIRFGHGEYEPRVVDPIRDSEIDNSIYNYAYSSVMDYAGRLTVDGAGIGKYDRAAILFGYADLVEVYRDHADVPITELAAWHENQGDIITGGGNLGIRTIHYTEFAERLGERMYDESNRFLVPVSAFDPDNFSEVTVDGETFARVPYIYCSHNRSDLGDNCLTRDAGADSQERMKNILDDLNTWYVLRNFPRGRIGTNTFNYVSRYYGRVYHRLKNWNNLYGLYSALLAQFFPPSTLEEFLNDPYSGFGTKTWAVQNAFNYLLQTLMMPDATSYDLPRQQVDGTRLSTASGGLFSAFTLSVADARYYSTDWARGDGGRSCGYMWHECLHHIGFYLDKIMAIEALSDSSTNFVARATPVDIREWEVSFYNTFPEQIAAINEAIMSQDWSRVAPYMDETRTLRFPNYAGDLSEVNAAPVDPFATFTIQLYWQVLGLARFPNNYDRSFVQESRIFELGSGAAPDLVEERLTSFTDPETGITYGAIDYADRTTAGAAMIQRAKCLQSISTFDDDFERTELNPFLECPAYADIPAFRWPTTTLPNRNQAGFALREYIELFEILADMSFMMEYGDPYNP